MEDDDYKIKDDDDNSDIAKIIKEVNSLTKAIEAREVVKETLATADMCAGMLLQIKGIIYSNPAMAKVLVDDINNILDICGNMIKKINKKRSKNVEEE